MAEMIIGSCLPCTQLREPISLRSKCEDRIEFSERFIRRNASGKKMDRKQTGRAYRPWCSHDSCPRRAETEEGKVYPFIDIIHMLLEPLFLRQNGLKLIM